MMLMFIPDLSACLSLCVHAFTHFGRCFYPKWHSKKSIQF